MTRPLRAVTLGQWRSLLRAAWWLGVVRSSLAVVGYRRTRTWTERTVPRTGRAAEPLEVGWSVEAIGRRIPGMRCLPRALAAEVILRRAGGDPRLRLGVVRDDRGGIEAHAWVEEAGRIVVGAQDRDRFTPLQA